MWKQKSDNSFITITNVVVHACLGERSAVLVLDYEETLFFVVVFLKGF